MIASSTRGLQSDLQQESGEVGSSNQAALLAGLPNRKIRPIALLVIMPQNTRPVLLCRCETLG